MAGYISDDSRKVTTHRLVEMKQRGEKISMLTAYDYTMAQIDRKSTRLNSSHIEESRMPSSA